MRIARLSCSASAPQGANDGQAVPRIDEQAGITVSQVVYANVLDLGGNEQMRPIRRAHTCEAGKVPNRICAAFGAEDRIVSDTGTASVPSGTRCSSAVFVSV